MTLQAREIFRQGDNWTVTQWLLACRGRYATDARDLVFAGLSLIKPELLSIQSKIRTKKPGQTIIGQVPLFAKRKSYPKQLPPFGVRWDSRRLKEGSAAFAVEQTLLPPKGLWPRLHANYDVDIAEVLVNTAACLMTHTGTTELLSIAARTGRPDVDTVEWFISPGDRLDLDELPSWVPAPGSWTSHVNDLLIPHPGETANLRNWVVNECQISHDGSTLELEASEFDTIDTLLLEKDFMDKQLAEVLTKLSLLADKPLGRHTSPISKLSQILVSEKRQGSSPESQYATEWLCHTLAFAVSENVYLKSKWVLINRPRRQSFPKMSRHKFANKLSKYYKKQRANIDNLLDAFDKIREAYPHEPWPNWDSPCQLDREVHIKHLRGEADQDKKKEETLSTPKGQQKKSSRTPKNGKAQSEKLTGAIYTPRDPIAHAKLTACALSTLGWRKVFVTQRGHIGLGPNQLTGGETIMHIRGASVPYVFITQAVDQNRREKQLRKVLDTNDTKYFEVVPRLDREKGSLLRRPVDVIDKMRAQGKAKRLDEEREVVVRKLRRLEREGRQEDAWVLQGEVFVEGAMGEDMRVEEPWRKIKIV